MYRELNTKSEMMKRLAYVVYEGCLFFSFFFAIRGIALGRPGEVLGAALLALVAHILRQHGVRHPEFRRVAKSFPMGSREEQLSTEQREQTEALLEAFHQTEDWTERQAIRHRLEALLEREPLLIETYGPELLKVHPSVVHAAFQAERQ